MDPVVPAIGDQAVLRVVGVQQYDSGEYQCQATSHPPSFIAATVSVVGELALVSTM